MLLATEIRWEALFLLSLLSQLCASVETKLPEEENKLKQRETEVKSTASASLPASSAVQFTLVTYHLFSVPTSCHVACLLD